MCIILHKSIIESNMFLSVIHVTLHFTFILRNMRGHTIEKWDEIRVYCNIYRRLKQRNLEEQNNILLIDIVSLHRSLRRHDCFLFSSD